MNRRLFLNKTLLTLTGVMLSTGKILRADDFPGIAGCSEENQSVIISSNHGHELVIPISDFVKPLERTYDIRGNSSHGHTVTLTPNDFEQLKAGTIIEVESSVGSHGHTIEIACA